MALSIDETIIWSEADGVISLFQTTTGEFHSLNETGSRIWKLIADGNSSTELASTLMSEFSNGDGALAVAVFLDAKNFVDVLSSRGWVLERD